MLTEVLSVGEIKEAIKESISNFEPLMGDNVKKDNKKIMIRPTMILKKK